METGSIIVRVYTSEAEIPIENASVTIYRSDKSGKKTILGVRSTDRNGFTPSLIISAPDKSISDSPVTDDTEAFSVCDIMINSPLYESVLITNAQIFSGVTSLQNAELIPLKENASPNEELREFNVTAHEL